MLGWSVACDVGQRVPRRASKQPVLADLQVFIVDMQHDDTSAGLVGEALRCAPRCSLAREVPCLQLDVSGYAVGGDYKIMPPGIEFGPQELGIEVAAPPNLRADCGKKRMCRY